MRGSRAAGGAKAPSVALAVRSQATHLPASSARANAACRVQAAGGQHYGLIEVKVGGRQSAEPAVAAAQHQVRNVPSKRIGSHARLQVQIPWEHAAMQLSEATGCVSRLPPSNLQLLAEVREAAAIGSSQLLEQQALNTVHR